MSATLLDGLTTRTAKVNTLEETADLYGLDSTWFPVEGDPSARIIQSARSGKKYRIAYDPRIGAMCCKCPAGMRATVDKPVLCWHLFEYNRVWLPLTYSLLPSQISTARNVPPIVYKTPAEIAAMKAKDFGN